MSPSTFEELLSFVSPAIIKQHTAMQDPVGPIKRLAVTLRYLVTGDAQCTIAASYRLSPTIVSKIIPETYKAIWDLLIEKKFIKPPSTQQEWITISKEFELKWNFLHALGALDGKHVVMQAPYNSGSEYFNYKKTHSIVLLAVCREANCSKNWHFGRLEASALDLDKRLRLSKHFFKASFKFFSCFCRHPTRKKYNLISFGRFVRENSELWQTSELLLVPKSMKSS